MEILLAPSKVDFEKKIVQLEKDFKSQSLKMKQEKGEFIEEQLKREQKLENEFHQEKQQWQINFQHLEQQKNKQINGLNDVINGKDGRIREQYEKIGKATELLKKQKAEIENKQKYIRELEI